MFETPFAVLHSSMCFCVGRIPFPVQFIPVAQRHQINAPTPHCTFQMYAKLCITNLAKSFSPKPVNFHQAMHLGTNYLAFRPLTTNALYWKRAVGKFTINDPTSTHRICAASCQSNPKKLINKLPLHFPRPKKMGMKVAKVRRSFASRFWGRKVVGAEPTYRTVPHHAYPYTYTNADGAFAAPKSSFNPLTFSQRSRTRAAAVCPGVFGRALGPSYKRASGRETTFNLKHHLPNAHY